MARTTRPELLPREDRTLDRASQQRVDRFAFLLLQKPWLGVSIFRPNMTITQLRSEAGRANNNDERTPLLRAAVALLMARDDERITFDTETLAAVEHDQRIRESIEAPTEGLYSVQQADGRIARLGILAAETVEYGEWKRAQGAPPISVLAPAAVATALPLAA